MIGLGAGGWAYPVLEPVEVGLRLREPAPDGAAGAPEPRPGRRLPRARRDGGHLGFEQALDELAEKVGVDPLELRRRNHTESIPPTAARTPPSGCSRATTRPLGWPAGSAATQLRGEGRIRRGMGCASQYWWGGGGPPAYAEVRIGAAARPVVTVGMQDLGTGIITACAIVAAERLGLSPSRHQRPRRRHRPGRPRPRLGRLDDAGLDRAGRARRRPTACAASCSTWPRTCTRSPPPTWSWRRARCARPTAPCGGRCTTSPRSSAAPG